MELDLMHALQNRRPLRQVEPEQVPCHIGGNKLSLWQRERSGGPAWERLNELQTEFLRSSFVMHERIRPQLLRMQELQRSATYDKKQADLLHELHGRFRRESVGNPAARCLWQLEQIVQKKPGWLQLQEELRKIRPEVVLEPIDVDGFYVIRSTGRYHQQEFEMV